MSFSLSSLAFVILVFALFYLIRRRARAYFLLLASLLFIATMDPASCIWVIVVTGAVYLLGLVEDFFLEKKKNIATCVVMGIGVTACVLSLLILKNVAHFQLQDTILSKLIMPLGFSYYIFQAIAYLVDICKGRMKAEKNILFFALYMCFFPKFISGPIEDPSSLLSQIKKLNGINLKGEHNLSIAFPTVLYGFFMKVVVADRIAPYTSKLLSSPESYGSLWLLAGMLMYSFQIYCDFAGYSSIAVGVARIFGIELTENFFAPYLSGNIGDFWHRWHVSLSRWLRNYIYIPLGGNRKGMARKYINTMVVFVICGMWHGAGLNFLLWGILHGVFMIVSGIVSKRRSTEGAEVKKTVTFLAGVVITFILVSFAWIFFGSASAGSAFSFVGRMLSFTAGDTALAVQSKALGINKMDILIPVYAGVIFAFDLLMVKKNMPIGKALYSLPEAARYAIEYLLIMAIMLLGIYGPSYHPENFMYMQF